MPNAPHASKLELTVTYDEKLKKNVQSWTSRCVCGWEQTVESRDKARAVYRSHRDGVPLVEAPRRVVVVDDVKERLVEAILVERGPLHAEEVRAELHRRGVELSEPSVRKLLRKRVDESRILMSERPSKRSKRIVLYAALGTVEEKFDEKVKAFDQTPSGFSVGRSF